MSSRLNANPRQFRERLSYALGLMSDLKLIIVEAGSLAIISIWMFHEVIHAFAAR